MNTTELLASIRQRASLPDAVTAGTDDASLLRYADEEVATRLVPYVLQVREDHFVVEEDVALEAGVAKYRIPSRAIGGKLRDLLLVDGSTVSNLVRIPPEDREDYAQSGSPRAFFFQASSVVVVPAPNGAGQSIRMRYHRRPNRLVATSAAATVSAVGDSALTISTPPSAVSAADEWDFVKATPGFETAAADVAGALVGTTLTPSDVSTLEEVEAGDYVCAAGYSPVIQLPEELHVLLAQRVACKVLEAMGDDAGLTRAQRVLQEMEQFGGALVANRMEGEAKLIHTRNGFLGGGRGFGIWGR